MTYKKTPTHEGTATIYTHPTCGYCDLMKRDLNDQGVKYKEVDVSREPEYWGEVERLSGGDKITPVTVMPNGEVLIGYKGIGCNYG